LLKNLKKDNIKLSKGASEENPVPIKSKSQQRLMYAAAEGKTDKVPKKVAKEMIESTPKSKFAKLKEKLSSKK